MKLDFNQLAAGPWGSYMVEENDRLWTLQVRLAGRIEQTILVWKASRHRSVARMIVKLVSAGVPEEAIYNED